MRSHDTDQEESVKEQANQTLSQKVEALQKRVREMGRIPDGSDDKAFMDEACSEGSGDVEGWDTKALRAAIDTGLNSGSPIPADQVFAELRTRNAAKTKYVSQGRFIWNSRTLI